MGTFAPRCRARRGGLLNRLTTDRWDAGSAVGGRAAPWPPLTLGEGSWRNSSALGSGENNSQSVLYPLSGEGETSVRCVGLAQQSDA
eukprot:1936588-Rhodomonas_salina.1